jgi:hypothetical protein
MNLETKNHPKNALDREGKLSGLGADAVWAGPWDSTGYPKGKGSSSGKDGMILNNIKPQYDGRPITQRAKPKF